MKSANELKLFTLLWIQVLVVGALGSPAPGEQQNSTAATSGITTSTNSPPVQAAPRTGIDNIVKSNEEFIDGITMPSVESLSGDPKDLMEKLMPPERSFFNKDALDRKEVIQLDCHLRNIDYCYVGMMGSMQKMLPETDEALESLCDGMKATASCLAVYNEKCGTFNVFKALAPFSSLQRSMNASMLPADLLEPMQSMLASANVSGSAASDEGRVSVADLATICLPSSKGSEANKLIRKRLFETSRCVNPRLSKLKPCIEDLKTAFQLLYEPGRFLPLQPSCCAMGRFRSCAVDALDRLCGSTAFKQLEAYLNSGPTSIIRTIDRVCRNAAQFDSPYCIEALPQRGLKIPQRRGQKQSKLAKLLDLMSFSPAVQE